jgi:hypothetical protein
MGKGLKNSDCDNIVKGLVKEKEEIATANKSYLYSNVHFTLVLKSATS